MSVAITDRIRRGQSAVSPFAVTWEEDVKTSFITLPTLADRDTMAEWKRMGYMTVYVIETGLEYQLGSDTTVAGQVWTPKTYGLPANVLVHNDILDINNHILPQLIQNIFLNTSYVVSSQAAMLALTSFTGNFFIRTDLGQVFIKLNNTNPAAIGDFATSTAPAVLSVNGQVGIVSITIANLLAVPANLTAFNSAVSSNTTVAASAAGIVTLNGSVATLTSNLNNLNNYVLSHLGTKALSPTLITPTAGQNGYLVKWDNVNNRFDLTPPGGVGGGATNFVNLLDVPASYAGEALKAVRVNAAETGLEFAVLSGNPFFDNVALLKNLADPTKLVKFDLTAITTATTRTYQLPDSNGTIPTLTSIGTFTNKAGLISQWTNDTGYITSLAGAWLLASGGTLTSSNTIIGTSSNILTYQFNGLTNTQVNGAGALFQNTSAAAPAVQQNSPSISWAGRGWATIPVASQAVAWTSYVVPISDTTNPTSTWKLATSINSAGYTDVITVSPWGPSSGLTGTVLLIAGSGTDHRISFNTPSSNHLIRSDSSGGKLTVQAQVGYIALNLGGVDKIRVHDGSASGVKNGDISIGSTTDAARLYVVQDPLSSNWNPTLKLIPGVHTSQNSGASSEFPDFVFGGLSTDANTAVSTRTSTWTTAGGGTVAIQRGMYIRGTVLTGASATVTFTNAYGVYIDPSTVGANAAITNNYALGLSGDMWVNSSNGRIIVGTDQVVGLKANNGTGLKVGGIRGGGGYTIQFVDNNDTVSYALFAPATVGGGTPSFAFGTNTLTAAAFYVSGFSLAAAWKPTFRIDAGAHTGITVENIDNYFNGARAITYTLNGTIAQQRFNYFAAPTSIAGTTGTTTFTNIYNVYIDGIPVAGANAAYTNSWALGLNGSLTITGTTGATYALYARSQASANGFSLAGDGFSISPLIDNNTALGTSSLQWSLIYGRRVIVDTNNTGATTGTALQVNALAYTGQTVERFDQYFNGARATTFNINGTIALQRFNYFAAPTSVVGSVATTTFTNIYNVYIDGLPAAGTNIAYGASWALGVNGNTNFTGASNVFTGTVVTNAITRNAVATFTFTGQASATPSWNFTLAGVAAPSSSTNIFLQMDGLSNNASSTASYDMLVIKQAVNGAANGLYRNIAITTAYTAWGGAVTGIDYNPTVTSITGTHLAFRATSGAVLIGGTTLTASTILDLQSTTLALRITNVTNIASVVTPANGMITYDAATNLFNFRQNGAWVTGLGGGSNIQTATVIMTQAQVANSFSVPVTLLAAPGAGKFVSIVGAVKFKYHFVTTAFTTGNNMVIQIGGNTISNQIAGTPLTIGADQYGSWGEVIWTGAASTLENGAVTFAFLTANPTGGGSSTVTITFEYVIKTL